MLWRRSKALRLGSAVARLPSWCFTWSRRVSRAWSLILRLKYFCRRGMDSTTAVALPWHCVEFVEYMD